MFCRLNRERVTLFLFTKKWTKKTEKLPSSVAATSLCGRILERLMFNEMLEFLIKSKIFSFNLLRDFLTERKQRVVLNGQFST